MLNFKNKLMKFLVKLREDFFGVKRKLISINDL